MKLLLLSNSRAPDGGYLTHSREVIAAVLQGAKKALFVPFAGVTITWDNYTSDVQAAIAHTGVQLVGAHQADVVPQFLAGDIEAIIVGGGNTFQLLAECRKRGWLVRIGDAVRSGRMPYIGWSAGANLAGQTINTTNDMPIVNPHGFNALGLVPFCINPHYNNSLPPGHQGETRDQRLTECLAANPQMRVVALPEGTWLEVLDSQVTVGGAFAAKVLDAGKAAVDVPIGSVIAQHA